MITFLARLKGTCEYEILHALDAVYTAIQEQESVWKTASRVSCTDGCGACCVAFEPDVLDCEALYLALWLIENEPAAARSIRDGTYPMTRSDNPAGCFLYDPDNPYHCTVYGGRCLICRLFGYSGDHGKDGSTRWKPCRFLSETELSFHTPPLTHRQYESAELFSLFNALPPVMSDSMSQVLSLSPCSTGTTYPLREILPQAIQRMQFTLMYNALNPENPDNITPESA
ncbi:MAG: YkgJ family cysteine cluster protein [Treponema sp.]|nr:YkgJ family cysteine cluster protein [Treponema sp.]